METMSKKEMYVGVRYFLGVEIPDGIEKLTKRAKDILRHFYKKGFAVWEQDDSEYETLEQIVQIAEESLGGRVILLITYDVVQVNSPPLVISGKFMLIGE